MKALHLAGSEDLDRVCAMVAAFHAEQGYGSDEAHIRDAVAPLLGGAPHGAVWLIGPRMSPVGYVAVSFGWSLEYGGLDAVVDEIYIRPAVRGRGMGGDALDTLAKALRQSQVRALHLEVDRADEATQRFYRRSRFVARDGYMFMSRVL